MRTNARSLASFLAGLFAIGILLSACDEQNEGAVPPDDTGTQQEGDMQDQNETQPTQPAE